MQRASLWIPRSRFLRQTAWTIGTSSALAVGYGYTLPTRPLLLDSSQDASSWTAKVEIDARNSAVPNRLNHISTGEFDSANKKGPKTSASQAPPPQTKGHSTFDVEGDAGDSSTWQRTTQKIGEVSNSFTGFDFTSIRDTLTKLVLPSWIRVLPGLVTKLQNELSMEPWSLSWEIWEEAHDPEANPEIIWDAPVRISGDLCAEEQAFLPKRCKHTAKALAKYLGVPESEVHPADVPIIAMCGSGGGLRALVAGASSYLSAHESGLFDCVTYTAGVSGSCWLQALYYSSIGQLSHQYLIDHLKQRVGIHIAYPPAALSLLNQAPTNKYLLSGFIEKLRGVPDADYGLVDVYGLLLAARLMVPRGELRVSDVDLKVSNQRYYIDDGHQPLPIYTAVRHEIPHPVGDVANLAKQARYNAKHYDFFQWFEWTPYEFSCEELNASIPTWAMGRRFDAGHNLWRENDLALPELRMPLLLGIWGSAFCATLSHYYREIRPILKAAGLSRLSSMLAENDEDLVKVHPIDPAMIPNFMLGLKDKLPQDCPESIHKAEHLQLMDAGMSNNLPIYPLLRPGRNVDIIVAFDASADIKTDNWIKVVGGYARQRKIKGWPMGAGWPTESSSSEEINQDMDVAKASAAPSTQAAEARREEQTSDKRDLGACTVWVGTTQEHNEFMDEPPSYRLRSDDSDNYRLKSDDAGLAVIYFPFLPNPKVKGVDPMKSEFMSTWNFVYTPEEIDQVVALARANFEEGREQTKRTIRAVWERKRAKRIKAEEEERDLQRLVRGRRGRAGVWRNGDVGHGDQFGGV